MNNTDFSFEDYPESLPTEEEILRKGPTRAVPKGTPPGEKAPPREFSFEDYPEDKPQEEPESFIDSLARDVAQIPQGLAKVRTYPFDIMAVINRTAGAELEELSYDELKELEGKDPWEAIQHVSQKKYGVPEDIGEYQPTQENLAKLIEKYTHIPLEAKTPWQKLLRLAGTAMGFRDGGITEKLYAGGSAPAMSAIFQSAGFSEPVSDLIGLIYSGGPLSATSGLNARPTNISGGPGGGGGGGPGGAPPALGGPGVPPGGGTGGGGGPPTTIYRDIYERMPATREAELVRSRVGGGTNREVGRLETQYQDLERAAGLLRPVDENLGTGTQDIAHYFRQPSPTRSPTLRGRRVSHEPGEGRDIIGVPNLQSDINNAISPRTFENSTFGGQALTNEIRALDAQAYAAVRQHYNTAMELNRGVVTTHPELADALRNIVREINRVPNPSGVNEGVRDTAQGILRSIRRRTRQEDGTILIEDIPISNAAIIQQIQDIRRAHIDYDYAHGDSSRLYIPIIRQLENAMERTADVGGEEAIESWRFANQNYRTWAERFDNKYVKPFRDTRNRSNEQKFEFAQKIDNFIPINDVLGASNNGQVFANAVRRKIVNKHLKDFIKNPRDMNVDAFHEQLRELNPVLLPNQQQQIRDAFSHHRRRIPGRVTAHERPVIETSRFSGLLPERVESMMDTVSGIRELRTGLHARPGGLENFQQLVANKEKNILLDNMVTKRFTGNEIAKVLLQRKNYELMAELRGKEVVDEMIQVAQEIGDRQALVELGKSAGKTILGGKALRFLLNQM